MKKSIHIRIPDPCHEDWNKMTPTQKGKFCSVCTKEVVDFTQATDEALVKMAHSGKKLCGRFRADQLDRELKLERKSGWSLAPLAASVLLPLSLMANPKPTSKPVESTYLSMGIGSLNKSQVIVSGVIKNIEGQPLNDVKLEDLETGNISYSNKDGSYRIVVAGGSKIEISKAGFTSLERQIGNYHEQRQLTLDIVLQSPTTDIVALLEGAVGCYKIKNNPDYQLELQTSQLDSVEMQKDSLSPTTIRGTVTDENGYPLPGANVTYLRSDTGVMTDFDGFFEIEIQKGQTLQIQYLGYESVELFDPSGADRLEIVMDPDYEIMGEVVVVGYPVVSDLMDHTPAEYNPGNPDRYYGSEEAVQARKQAYANEVEYKRIKAERRKAARSNKKKQ